MAPRPRGFYGLELGTVTFSGIDPSGFHAIQVDAFGEGSSGMSPFELSHPYGFASRALNPTADGKGCSAFYWLKGSSEGFAWLANDPRVQALLPEIQPGESFHYGPKGQFVRCHADGRVSIFTTDDATPNGRSVYFQVAPTGFTWVAPWGRITFDANGFHVVHVSGARIDLGAIGGLPAPLDQLSSYATLSGHMVRLEGSALSLGPGAGEGEPAAKALTTLAVLQSLAAALDAVGASLAALTGVPTNTSAASGPTATAATAITAAQLAVTAAIDTLPSSSMVS